MSDLSPHYMRPLARPRSSSASSFLLPGTLAALALLAACSDSIVAPAPTSPTQLRPRASVSADATPLGAGFHSCADVHAALPSAPDGEYIIGTTGGYVRLYCANLSTAPAEYLTLAHTGGGYNYASTSRIGQVKTNWTRYRLDPSTLEVNIADLVYATTTGSGQTQNRLTVGHASNCGGPIGTANVDLTGTPFKVHTQYTANGWFPYATVNGQSWSAGGGATGYFPVDAQIVNVSAGGGCGGATPAHEEARGGFDATYLYGGTYQGTNPWQLQLAVVGPTIDPAPAKIAPVVTGTLSSTGWYTSDVGVHFDVTAPASGVLSTEGCDDQTVTTDTQGQTYTCTVTNGAGVGARVSVTVKRDASAPVITGIPQGTTGSNGWYVSTVSIPFSAADDISGIATSTGCTTVAQTTDTDANGVTFTCSATNGAGLTSTQSYTIKRDVTAPTVTYAGNTGSYTVDQSVAITCRAADAVPGSGVASSTCVDATADAYTFAIGNNTLSATATDAAGNVGSGQTSFQVSVNATAICNLISRWVSNGGVANSLCVKVQHGDYDAFRNELSAQTDKKIAADKAKILLGLVAKL